MIFRMISPKWITLKPETFEGEYELEQIRAFNVEGYNCYFYPNYPSDYESIPVNPKTERKRPVKATDIDVFDYCFVDMDLKDYKSENADRTHNYETKQAFIDAVLACGIPASSIVDTGGGIHVYWRVSGLDAMSFLRLNRRLCRLFKTDPAVCNIKQLMRVPGTINTKKEEEYRLCEVVHSSDAVYSPDQLNELLPPISPDDEAYCLRHYDQCMNVESNLVKVTEELPKRFRLLCRTNTEVRRLFYGQNKDRSIADFRLAHILEDQGFTKEEAESVLFNTSKASERTKIHRFNYARNITDKIWIKKEKEKVPAKRLSKSAKEILQSMGEDSKLTRFPCHPMMDATKGGFRLSQVLGLIGGSGNGKSTLALNLFAWFTEFNKDKNYVHLYVSLEQPDHEITAKWSKISAYLKTEIPGIDWDDTVEILGNYDEDGTYRNLGMEEIKEAILRLEKDTGKKVGCVVIDHIGIVKQEKGQNDDSGLIGVCRKMKSLAVATNTFLIMQSQTSRAKNSGGDVELDMDAAFGTSNFEFYADYIVTTWQPLKRIYDRAPHMTYTAFKMAKIRAKDILKDDIKQDVVYAMKYEPDTERYREMTTEEHKAFDHWATQANKIRQRDKKKEPSQVRVITWTKKEASGKSGKTDNH